MRLFAFYAVGWQIIAEACLAPLRQIVSNAAKDADRLVAEVGASMEKNPRAGYDAKAAEAVAETVNSTGSLGSGDSRRAA